MYSIEFYEKEDGTSELWEFLDDLRKKSATSKDARIQYKQIGMYIQLLADKGTHLPDNVTKHIDDGIWELRPGNNRIFYFFFENDTFVLLHQFRKRLKKHHAGKLIVQKQNAAITFPERSNHENLGRL